MLDPTILQIGIGELLSQHFTGDALAVKDFALGFFLALALRRGRIRAVLDRLVPTQADGDNSEDATDGDEEAN